jgi:hypothetical protein
MVAPVVGEDPLDAGVVEALDAWALALVSEPAPAAGREGTVTSM